MVTSTWQTWSVALIQNHQPVTTEWNKAHGTQQPWVRAPRNNTPANIVLNENNSLSCSFYRKNVRGKLRNTGRCYVSYVILYTAQKMKFSIKDLFSKWDQTRSFLWIWSHFLKKSLMENFILCVVLNVILKLHFRRFTRAIIYTWKTMH